MSAYITALILYNLQILIHAPAFLDAQILLLIILMEIQPTAVVFRIALLVTMKTIQQINVFPYVLLALMAIMLQGNA